MRLDHALLKELRVPPGERPHLDIRPTSGAAFLGDKAADRDLEGLTAELERAQELLYSTESRALLVVLQGLDAAGKDGTIKHVMSGVNPQGCTVTSFKEPSAEELAHDFLWRSAIRLPPRGHIGLFNRSYYEDVVVVCVHPDRLPSQFGRSGREVSPSFWHHRHDDINVFEKHLDRNGTQVVKFFLHLSKVEQRRRLLDRLNDPTKNWKFSRRTLRSAPTGRTTRQCTRRSSLRRRRNEHPGSSFRLTTNTSPEPLWPRSSFDPSTVWNCPRRCSRLRRSPPSERQRQGCWPGRAG